MDRNKTYKVVIFDMDGTILDTLADLADSANWALANKGMPVRSYEQIRSFLGNGVRCLIEQAVPENTSEEIMLDVLQNFSAHYKAHCADKTKPYEGIKELIGHLRKNGIKTAVVSNKVDFAVQPLCREYFPGLFDIALGEKEGIRRKPYPDSVLEVLKQLEMSKEDAVYIGDSEVDIKTAQNAGMDQIIVTWGFRDEKQLKQDGAEMLAHDMQELEKMLLG